MHNKLSRRQCLSLALGAGATCLFPAQHADAAAERVSVADPKAAALAYVEDASKVDARKFSNYKPGQTCANCKLIQLRYGFYRPCELFPGKVVNAKGWCSAWAAKTYS